MSSFMDKWNSPEFRAEQEKYEKETDARCEKAWNDLDYDLKLDILRYVGGKLVEHAEEGGSYRTLLYSRFSLDMDSYCYLLDSFMTISNEFIIAKSIPEQEFLTEFKELAEKIPVYLIEEDKAKFNFNKDRQAAFDFYFQMRDINEALAKSEEKYNRLLEEFNQLRKEKSEVFILEPKEDI